MLNPLLLMGIGPFPKLGIAGSATSTLVAQTLTLALMIAHLYRKRSILVLRPSEWRLLLPDVKLIWILVTKGAPMSVQMAVISLAAVTMLSFVNRYGVHTSAGYGAAAQEKDNLMKLSKLSGFRPSSNAQLIPIRQLELFKERNKIEADAGLGASDKQAKLAEIDRKLADLAKQL